MMLSFVGVDFPMLHPHDEQAGAKSTRRPIFFRRAPCGSAAKRKANRPSLVYCGDDPKSKELAAGLIGPELAYRFERFD
jgi:hypothetical protein